MKSNHLGRRVAAITPLIATMVTLSMTLVTGFAVFGFVNSESGASAKAYGTSVNAFVEQTRERFLIANIAYDYPSSDTVTIWFYNYGSIDTKITTIYAGTSPSSLTTISSGSLPLTVGQGAVVSIAITYTTTTGTTYYFKALGAKGNTQLYFQLK